MRDRLIKQLTEYIPFNEQEERDKELILSMLQNNEDVFYRSSLLVHMTASAWIVNKERTKTVMVYHNIYNSWSWLGGHADGEEDLLKVAEKEVREESGLQRIRPVSDKIFSIEVLTVNGHEKKGNYVGSHLHLNITYLMEADEEDSLTVKTDENSGVKWFTFEDAIAASTEEWFKQRIYPKLVEKTAALG